MPENECLFERQFRIRLVLNRLKHAKDGRRKEN